MRQTKFFLITCLLAGLVPFYPRMEASRIDLTPFPGWPTTLSALPLRELPLEPQEKSFAKSFPGQIGRFTDGKTEYVIRWVTQPTRMLHPAADCFRGNGYDIHPLPLKVDIDATVWGSFEASNDNKTFSVQERIYSDEGYSWTDVSSWYWAAIFGKTTGPWWAVTRVSRPPLVSNPFSTP